MGGIDSMNIDGSNKVNIIDTVFCSHLTIEGEELFYINLKFPRFDGHPEWLV